MILAAALLLQAAALPPQNRSPFCRQADRREGRGFVDLVLARRCGVWLPPRRHVGVWLLAFEVSTFVEGATTVEQARRARAADEHAAWLMQDEKSRLPYRCKPILGNAYFIDFDGSASPMIVDRHDPRGFFYGYGHMGGWRRQMLVNRVHAMHPIGDFGMKTPLEPETSDRCRTSDRRSFSSGNPR